VIHLSRCVGAQEIELLSGASDGEGPVLLPEDYKRLEDAACRLHKEWYDVLWRQGAEMSPPGSALRYTTLLRLLPWTSSSSWWDHSEILSFYKPDLFRSERSYLMLPRVGHRAGPGCLAGSTNRSTTGLSAISGKVSAIDARMSSVAEASTGSCAKAFLRASADGH
jgi:hypothetical protein